MNMYKLCYLYSVINPYLVLHILLMDTRKTMGIAERPSLLKVEDPESPLRAMFRSEYFKKE